VNGIEVIFPQIGMFDSSVLLCIGDIEGLTDASWTWRSGTLLVWTKTSKDETIRYDGRLIRGQRSPDRYVVYAVIGRLTAR